MNNTPLVIVLVLTAAAAAGGWYKYLDERGVGSEESRRAEQLATDYETSQGALQETNAQLRSAKADVDRMRAQAEHLQAAAQADAEKNRTQTEQSQAAARADADKSRAQIEQLQAAARTDAENFRLQAGELQMVAGELAQTQGALRRARDEFEVSARQAEQVWDNERAAWVAERAAWESERADRQRNRDGLQADLDSQRRTADARIKQLTLELAAAQGTERTTRSELERLRAVVARLGEHEQMVGQLSAQLRNKDTDLSQMEARMAELESAAAQEKTRFAQLHDSLQSELADRNVQLEQLENKLTLIRVGSDILFETGSSELSGGGEQTLALVARILAEYPDRQVNVEGHTDDVPIGRLLLEKYPSNWELSAARAARAVRYLQDAGIDAQRLNVVGHGAERPVTTNEDADSRARNRRIEIAVLPSEEYQVVERK